jgi:sulfotransferase
MTEKIFFQCSLPRVGSTLFQNLISQDKRIYASANNGLLQMMGAARKGFEESAEYKAETFEQMQQAFAGFSKGAMHGFYNGITDRQYALDKSRGHFANYALVNSFYPDPKIICFVRDMPDIFASIEKLHRKNQYKASQMVDHGSMQGTTTPKRVYLSHQSFVPMMNAFANSIANRDDKKMLFIRYEDFCLYPEQQMQRIYAYLEIPPFMPDYNKIVRTIQENEETYHYTGLFNIRPQLQMQQSNARQILGDDVITWLKQTYALYNQYFGY